MRPRDRIQLAWLALTSTELDNAIDTALQATVDTIKFQTLTGRTLSEANRALTLGEIEIKEKTA